MVGLAPCSRRAERWTLYHQLTLLERSIRRAAVSESSGLPSTSYAPSLALGVSTAGNAAPESASHSPPSNAFNAHLHWFLPPVASLLRCVHGLSAAEAQHALGLLSGITEMDPIEKALRSGEDRDILKDQAEPRCVAGASAGGGEAVARRVAGKQGRRVREWGRGVLPAKK